MTKYSLEDFLNIKVSIDPSFSPDGSKVAYLNNTPGTFQLHLTELATKKTRQLTDYENRLLLCSYSPTEDKILFGMDEGGDENVQFYLYDVTTDSITRITERSDVMYKFGDWSKDGKHITYASNEINGTDFDIYVRDMSSGEATCIFKENGWCESNGFSPDGTKVVVTRRESLAKSDLYIVGVQTLSAECITSGKKNTDYGHICWLEDSQGFFLASNEDRDFYGIDTYDIATSSFHSFMEFEWDVEDIILSPDYKTLSLVLNEDGYTTLQFIDVEQKSISKIDKLARGMSRTVRWSNDSKKIVFASETPQITRAIYTCDLAAQNLERVSEVRQEIESSELISPELIHYKTFDGLEIPAFLYLPKTHDDSRKLSVIISIHGGPEAQYRPFFDTVFQFFLHHGYAIVAPNVRGSFGYGKHYMSLDDREKRLDSVQDIVWLKKHLETRPEIDRKRIVLMGGSYGGYMVLANLAFFPEHWAAGIDIVGIANFVTFLENTSLRSA